MQTAAAATFSAPLVNSRAASSERIPPYWDDEREEWVGTPTEEEKFAALKATVEESFRDIDEGRYFEGSSLEELEQHIGEIAAEARAQAFVVRVGQSEAVA